MQLMLLDAFPAVALGESSAALDLDRHVGVVLVFIACRNFTPLLEYRGLQLGFLEGPAWSIVNR